jgi:hypothetical protein
MKICLFDPYNKKFTAEMISWWETHGHEVQFNQYYNPQLVEWADVVFFETTDNNLLSATNPDQALLADDSNYRPWSMHDMDLTDKKIIVRPIDIEVYTGHHAHENIWELVTDCIFIAPHIRDIMMEDSRPQASNMKIHVIPHSINPDKWTFKERKPGFNIGVVAERWVSKGTTLAIQLAMALPEYNIYWLGKNNDYHWQEFYLQDKVAKLCPNLHLEEGFVDDLDSWWEDKQYVLSCSMKEAFGCNIAEAMAKGIKPLIHTFYGYEPIWGDSGYTWSSIDECVKLIKENKYNSQEYLDYLVGKGYTVDMMMDRIMGVING